MGGAWKRRVTIAHSGSGQVVLDFWSEQDHQENKRVESRK